MTRAVSLWVNDVPISLDYFVQGFIDHTIGGMIAALKDTGEIDNLELAIEGEEVSLNLNNAAVPVNDFLSKIIKGTVTGMLSPLKGVSEIKKVKISISR